jgi:hypothetical protein
VLSRVRRADSRSPCRREIDSLSSDGAQLVASLLARIDRLMAHARIAVPTPL